MKRKRFSAFFLPIILAFSYFLLSCATSPEAYKNIDFSVNENNFEAAVKEIKTGQEKQIPIYPSRNAIMLFLDKGLLEFYAGNYEASSQDLQEAERLIEEAYTKSISANFLSYIVNDNTKEYPGEDFEDIYINVFNALNYYKKGNIEGALVEIRKLTLSSGKLDMLARKYNYKDPASGASLEELVRKETGSGNLPDLEKINFSNSALARYLSALFYQADGNLDSARIEFEQLQRAFLTQKNIYKNPIPEAVEQARNIPEGKARLNIISFTGLSPVKEEEIIEYNFPGLGYSLNLATFKLPKLVKRPSLINRIEVVIDGEEHFDLELLEDIGAVIQETFAIRYSNIVLKTYIRTLMKYTTTVVAAAVIAENQSEALAVLFALAAKKTFEATENADIRMSRYLPDKAHIGGINLTPGKYNVTVNFYSGGRIVSAKEYRNIAVRERGLNLIDAANLN